jgi:hypothetical protein
MLSKIIRRFSSVHYNKDLFNSIHKKTSIICSIGENNSKEFLSSLILNGMNIARLNFSHG